MVREPDIAASPEVYTLSDLVHRLTYRTMGTPSTRNNVLCVRAIQDAIRSLAGKHDWSVYQRRYRFQSTAPVSSTFTYDHTGGSSERMITLTGSTTWPTDATSGYIKVGTITYRIDSRVSSTVATLRSQESLNADTTGELTWYRNSYALPRLIQKIHHLYDRTAEREVGYVRASSLSEAGFESGTTAMFTWMHSGDAFGGSQIVLSPAPSQVSTYEAFVTTMPIIPRIHEVTGATASVTSGSTAVSCSGAAFTNKLVGSVFRLSLSSTLPSDDNADLWEFQAFITAVPSATTLTLAEAVPITASGRGYLISSPIDIDAGCMLNCLESEAYAHYCRNHKHESIGAAMGLAKADLIQSVAMDNKVSRDRCFLVELDHALMSESGSTIVNEDDGQLDGGAP